MGRRGLTNGLQEEPISVFFLPVGNTKKEMYKTKSCLVENWEIRMQEVFNDIPDDLLQKVVRSIPGGLRKLVEASSPCF